MDRLWTNFLIFNCGEKTNINFFIVGYICLYPTLKKYQLINYGGVITYYFIILNYNRF